MAFTALVVPVPAASWLLDRAVAGTAGDPDGPRIPGLPAHLTLITPFAPPEQVTDGLLDELTALFADVVPFWFRLSQVCRFPNGPVYLAPEPAAPFRRLVRALAHAFPEHPPYEGRFDDVVPHVTVPLGAHERLEDLQDRLDAHGPLRCEAREAHLVRVDDEAFELVAQFGFGTVAA